MVWSRSNPGSLTIVIFGLLLAAAMASPILLALGRVEGFAVRMAFGPFCHQELQRCWALLGEPMPICVRCLGFYTGGFGVALLGLGYSGRALVLACLVTLGSATAESAGLSVASELRFLAGIALGVSVAAATGVSRVMPEAWMPPHWRTRRTPR